MTRNLNPTPAARIAMVIWGDEYAAQCGGSMDFWDSLDADRKRRCEAAAAYVVAARTAEPEDTQRSEASHNETLALIEAAERVVAANLAKQLRQTVAGWDGENRPESFSRHPADFRATIPTTCGDVYEMDDAAKALDKAVQDIRRKV